MRQLALQYPKSPLNDGLLVIYLTARDRGRGEEALRILQSDPELKKAKVLASDGGLTDIKFHELDISNTKSIQEFSSFLRKQHPDGIDFGPQKCQRLFVPEADENSYQQCRYCHAGLQ